jgi:hypothetical protein
MPEGRLQRTREAYLPPPCADGLHTLGPDGCECGAWQQDGVGEARWVGRIGYRTTEERRLWRAMHDNAADLLQQRGVTANDVGHWNTIEDGQ